jgi:hypothetical protein
VQAAAAEPLERELLEVLLAGSALVTVAREQIAADEIRHPGLRRLLEGLYDLLEEAEEPDLDALRLRIADRPQLADHALKLREVGRMHPDRSAWLEQILAAFAARRRQHAARQLQGKLSAAGDHDAAVDLLRKLQKHSASPMN